MVEPLEKSAAVRKTMDDLAGTSSETSIRENRCALCGKTAKNFKDSESRREFAISGMCQRCQEEAWGPGGYLEDPDDDDGGDDTRSRGPYDEGA